MEKRALGKGLEALIPKKKTQMSPTTDLTTQQPEKSQGQEYIYIDIAKLTLSPFQSRQSIPQKELEDLKQSIQQQGILQPLVVREKEGRFEIVAGSRRFEAAKSLGLKELPIIIKKLDDRAALLVSIMENLQRQDLNPLEEAESLQRLIKEFNLSHQQIAENLGKDRSTITNTLRLLSLPEPVKQALRQGKISKTQARALLSIKDEAQMLRFLQDIQGLPVNLLEEKVRRTKPGRSRSKKDIFLANVESGLQEQLGRKVTIINRGKKGRVVLEFYSQEDLEALLKLLGWKGE